MRYAHLLGLLFLSFFSVAQSSKQIDSALAYQRQLDLSYSDCEDSPLTEDDLEHFKGLPFFKVDTNYIVKAKFEKIEGQKPFVMPTTTERKPLYLKYAKLSFKLKDSIYALYAYQNQQLVQDSAYVDYLFLPFTDRSNGVSSYRGGRYLDVRIPKKDSLILDFNRAYNPYCAYNPKYSCPIPPEENDLPVAINAGVKYRMLY
ncbi:DUF1684 domain-containing protein [Gangjinia marincola]|uniref:DUF1684 domain-containing protein n=1 Tax=Gangjinia marincola TaxID=578463 RepID=A0ABN1MKB4_9FLAO